MKQGKVFLDLGFMIGLLLATIWISGCSLDRQENALESADGIETTEASKSLPPINPEDVMRYGREVYLLRETESIEEERNAKTGGADEMEDSTEVESVDGTDDSTEAESSDGTDDSTEAESSDGTDGRIESESVDGTSGSKKIEKMEETKNSSGEQGKPEGETTEASSVETSNVEAGSVETKDSTEVEGSVANSTAADPCADGHVYGELCVWREATCTIPADLCQVCVRCGAERHLSGGLAEHALTKTMVREGNCLEPYEYRYDCANCDYFTYEKDYSQMENGHQYSTGSYQEFDENLLEWITITVTKCGICGKELERTRSE